MIIFVLTWIIALSVWHFGRIEQRWSLAPAASPPASLPQTGDHDQVA